ncbi:MAG: IPT/TIG domain-containing protein [Methanoregula sp.]
MKNHSITDRGASETIGAVMLISIVVLAVAIIGVVLTSQGTPEKLPAVSAIISSSNGVISIYHDGGDSLTSRDLSILVDGKEEPFTKSGSPAPWTWSVGDTIRYDMSPDTPRTVRVVYTPGSYTIASANFAAMGSAPVPTTSTTITPSTSTPTPVPLPVAEFAGTPLSGTSPFTVAFTDHSTNTPTSWVWNFGDAGTATVKNPSHQYTVPGTYTVSLKATNAGGSDTETKTGYITVSAPTPVITAISPTSGPAGGGTTVTITGSNFTGASTVKFGTTANVTGVMTVVSSTQITVISPSGPAGTVHVTVTSPNGTSATSPADQYTYRVPAVTAISPTSGSTSGGTMVTITGNDFTGASTVRFGTTANVTGAMTVVSSTQITVTSPAGSAGTVHVTVTTPNGTSATSAADQYTYTVPTYVVVSFTTVGTTSWTAPTGVTSVEYLVVGGGGGGGGTSSYQTSYGGGGGGAGGFLAASGYAVTPGTSYTVIVGAGGAGGPTGANSGTQGGNSRFGTIISTGGGYGAGSDNTAKGGNGGSGGGGVANGKGGSGTSGQGYDGGDGYTHEYLGGGGGGSSHRGYDAGVSSAGIGGDGIASSISGSSTTYAGGGGGGSGWQNINGGTGGSGGGGAGGASGTHDGTDATGYGSGGGGGTSNAPGSWGKPESGATAGGNGSNGIIIIRYLNP